MGTSWSWWRGASRLAALADEIAGNGPEAADGAGAGSRRARCRLAHRRRAEVATACEPANVVNNAGFGLAGPSAALDRGEQLAMIDLNVRALTELSLTFVESLVRHRGGILNVASIAAFLPGPGMAVYYASKAYVLSFSEALHSELSRRGVRVTALCPGPVATEFQTRAGLRPGGQRGEQHFGAAGAARGRNRLRGLDARQARRRCRVSATGSPCSSCA